MKSKAKMQRRQKRKRRIGGKIFGDTTKPRLSVFRSNKHIYTQIIDDTKNSTLVSVNDLNLKIKSEEKKTDVAYHVGEELAKKALKKKVRKVVFDRGGYKFHGRVKALAEGARKGGLKF